MCQLPNEAAAAFSRLDDLATLQQAFTELLAPETDLHLVDRDNLSIALELLRRWQAQALEQLRQALPKTCQTGGL